MAVFPEANYFLVDPLPENERELRRLSRLHPSVRFWCGALGPASDQMTLHVHGDQSSFWESEFDAKPLATQLPVEVRTLDSFLESGEIAPPQLIKADVQGFELQVLNGAEQCLQSAELMLLEVSFRRVYEGSPLADEVIAYATAHGFRIYDICDYVPRRRDHELTHGDILFARSHSQVFSYEGWE